MASPRERLTARVADVRRRRPLVDHLVRMQEHYSEVRAGRQAGAVTYYAFLSFFPILALAFFIVGLISRFASDARDTLTEIINAVMPELVGTEQGQLQLEQIEKAASTLGIVGVIVLLYSGLGWLSAMRDALLVVFETPVQDRRGFVSGKLRDLFTLVLLGVILIVAVAVAGLVGGFSAEILEWAEVDLELGWLLSLSTVVLGFVAGMLLFVTMFVLLAAPHTPRPSLWAGAALGAVAFEVLKQLSGLLLRLTEGNPAFQAFGIALVLLIWINYTSRIILYAAAFAHTSRAARALREPAPVAAAPARPAIAAAEEAPAWVTPYVAGAVSTLGLVAVMRKLTGRKS